MGQMSTLFGRVSLPEGTLAQPSFLLGNWGRAQGHMGQPPRSSLAPHMDITYNNLCTLIYWYYCSVQLSSLVGTVLGHKFQAVYIRFCDQSVFHEYAVDSVNICPDSSLHVAVTSVTVSKAMSTSSMTAPGTSTVNRWKKNTAR